MIVTTPFTPLASLAGGILIGLAAVALMAFRGRIAGISGIVSRLLPPYEDGELAGRAAFAAGLVASPLAYALMSGQGPDLSIVSSLPLLALAGVLVGFGSTWGFGCTSGHGVCGLARLSQRSAVATCIFMIVAIATAIVMRHVA